MDTLATIINAMGWMLIHFLWQGCLIVAAYWLVCRLSSRRSALLHYWSGMAAYLAAAIAPVITLIIYLWPGETVGQGYAIALPVVSINTGYPVTPGSMLANSLEPMMPLIVGLWVVGVALMSVRTLFGWLGVRSLVRHGASEVSSSVQRLADDLALRLGVQRNLRVLRSARVAVPTVVGWLKPVILLPLGVLSTLPREQLAMVIAHELTHIRRNDYLFNVLQLLVETLFFYHPAIGWLGRRVRDDREHCCDDEVVRSLGEPVLYARSLASLEHLRAPMAPALGATGGDLYHRVHRIVQSEPPRQHSGFSQLAMLVGVAALASVSVQQGLELRGEQQVALLESPLSNTSNLSAASVPSAALGEGLLRHGENLRQARAEEELQRQAALQAQAKKQAAAIRNVAKTVTPSSDHSAAVSKPFTPVTDAPEDLRLARLEPKLQAATEAVDAPVLVSGPGIDSSALDLLPAMEVLPESTQAAISANSNGGLAEDPWQGRRTIESIDVIFQVEPEYPYRAYRAAVEGQVRIQFKVDPQTGRPRDLNIVGAAPEGVFDEAASRALSQWRFEVKDGLPPDLLLYQVFEFTQPEINGASPNGQRNRRCSRTGSNVCGRHFSDENVLRFGS